MDNTNTLSISPPRTSSDNSFLAMRNMLTIFALMVFLGFPGNFSKIIGGSAVKMIEYLSFAIQFILVMMASGDEVKSVKLVSLYPAYWIMYLYVFYLIADSLMVVSNKKTVIITLVHLLLTVMFSLWLVEQFDLEEMLELVYSAQLVIVGICLICMVILPKVVFYTYQGAKTFCGLYANKNGCATELSFGILVQLILLLLRVRNKKKISIVFIAMIPLQFGMLLLCKAAGAVFITIACVGYSLFYSVQKKKQKLPLGFIFIVVTIGFLIFALTVLQILEPFLNSIGKDASLTGRVPIWNQVIKVMQESHTMTGYGYEMFWKTDSSLRAFRSGFSKYSWAYNSCSNSHNTIMELWCNTGLIGVVLYYFMFFSADRGIKHLNDEQYIFCSCFMVLFTVRALTERQTDPATVYVMMSFVALAMMYQAHYSFMQSKLKTARIYKNDQQTLADVTREDVPEWFAFQSKFSNVSDTKKPSSNQNSQFAPLWDDEPHEKSFEQKMRELEEEDW